jgi:hypothetical protein
VINYADALCNCVNSIASGDGGSAIGNTFSPVTFNPTGHPGPQPLITTGADVVDEVPPAPLPTAARYALMTKMAENTIAGPIPGVHRGRSLETYEVRWGLPVNFTQEYEVKDTPCRPPQSLPCMVQSSLGSALCRRRVRFETVV